MAVAVMGPAKEVACTAVVSQPERTVRTGTYDGKRLRTDYLSDNYIITLNWGNGTIGVVDAGFTQLASTVNMLEVYGTKGTLTILGQVKIGEGDGVRLYMDSPELKVRGWLEPLSQDRAPRAEFQQCECLLDLIHAIETDTHPTLDPRIARHVVDIMCTIPRAIQEKRTLPLSTDF